MRSPATSSAATTSSRAATSSATTTSSAAAAPLGVTAPDLATFRELARDRRVIPVTRRLLADAMTPVGLYATLAHGKPGTFLLESAEHGRSWSRWSFVGAASSAALSEVDGRAHWWGTVPAGLPTDGDPLDVLAETLRTLQTEPLDGLPPLTGGMVGYLGYDVIRRIERLDADLPDEIGAPELVMLLATDLAALDHHEGTVTLIANAINYDNSDERVDAAYHDAVARLDEMAAALARPAALPAASFEAASAEPASVEPASFEPTRPVKRRTSSDDYRAAVRAAQEHIYAGDAFQVVISQRFDADLGSDDTALQARRMYRVLRATNPSPYMYLLQLPTPAGDAVWIVGSSPEALVTVDNRRATMHPIAGTRPRGVTDEDDLLHEKDLLADEKERSEHTMLVDLGRNDLGKVCEPGSVSVPALFTVERYSHVMHIVSTVTGTLAADRTALDAVTACFPAGTLSGAPKPRALQIIDSLEPARRGPYGGIVGYLDFAGNADTAIAIRTAVLRGRTAHVQAGAGVVADSVPEAEDAECQHKAAAVLGAVAAAATWRDVT